MMAVMARNKVGVEGDHVRGYEIGRRYKTETEGLRMNNW